MKIIARIIIGVMLTVFIAIGFAFAINRYYYDWTDYINPFGCIRKTAKSPTVKSLNEYKLNYFTKAKFSYESLHSDIFAGKIKTNPNYTVEKQLYNGSSESLQVKRTFDGSTYIIWFYPVWKSIKQTSLFDGFGVSYDIHANCGIPDYILEKNIKLVINELPLDKELRNEMIEKLSLEFSNQGNSMKLF